MQNSLPSESSEVPAKIQSAERWRVAGAELKQLAPDVFEQLFAMLVVANLGLSERSTEIINESYLVT